MNDFITSQDRLTFVESKIDDFFFEECAGCGITTDEIQKEYDCTYDDIECNSVTTNSGLWYCHTDCYRDSH